MSKIIYKSSQEVECWILGEFYTSTVETYIIQYKFLRHKFNKIKQFIPYLNSPTFDGEFASNKKLKLVAKDEKFKAKMWLIKNK